MSVKSHTWLGRRGVAAVEFAVALPLLVTIMLGAVDFGRFAFSHVAVRNASSEAATWGAHTPITDFPGGLSAWTVAVQTIAVNETKVLEPSISTDQVTVDATVLSEGRVRVTIEYDFHTVVPWPGIPAEVSLYGITDTPQIP